MNRTSFIGFLCVVTLCFAGMATSTAWANGHELEPNDLPELATPVSCDCDVAGGIDLVSDVDYFSFTLTATTNLQIYTTLAGGDSVIDLMQADGVTSIEFDDDGGIGLASHIGRQALPPGSYFVRLRPYAAGQIFQYVLSLRCPAFPNEVEPNATTQTATALACEALGASGDIGTSGDVDIFSFDSTSTASVAILGLTAPTHRDLSITLLNASGGQVAAATDSGYELGPSLTAALGIGRYFLRVTSGSTGTHYDASIRVDGRVCTVVNSIDPTSGLATGGELVSVSGDHFGDITEVSLRMGGVAATVLTVSPTLITARTPPGTGTVDVTVVNRGSSVTLPRAYTFVAVPPDIEARYGNVNVALGNRESVLLVNAQQGDDMNRELTLGVRQAISIVMTQPSSRVSARFALYVWVGAPTPALLTTLPRGLGNMVLPPPFMPGGPHPRVVFNNAGFNRTLGAPTFPSHPAPTQVLNRPRGLRNPATLTLQGLIQDNGSQIPEHWSITNAVILRVQ
ncbi:MAG: IPT/TIG domain-containing protein [Planctomycetes bacterium]|nr:IPT/TIG domain-containing protein [Planctomycetota bacterium]MBI3847146.1 IPT/TIG domain-containing protein [Planctomycetota bacterium]